MSSRTLNIERQIAKLDRSLDKAVQRFDNSFSKEIREEIIQAQNDMKNRTGIFSRYQDDMGGWSW
jgi:hypothetical protein